MQLQIPPQAREVEANLLGILMVVPGAATKAILELKPEDFYVTLHKLIFTAITKLQLRNEAVDITSVVYKLVEMKEKVTPFEVSSLTNSVIGELPLEGYIRVVKEKSILRRIINLTADFNSKAYDESNDPSELLGKLLGQTSAIMQEQQGKNVEHIGEVIMKAIKLMQEASQREGHLVGIPSSIPDLSKLTLGYAAPDLTIIAAGTSEGKSTLMLNEAKKAAKEGHNVAIFSLEMSNVQLVLKVFNDELNIDMNRLRTGQLHDNEWDMIYGDIVDKLQQLNIFLYDIGGLSIVEFQSIVKQLKAKHGDNFIIFLDYLQLMTTTGVQQKFSNREGEVSFISRQLKATCKNENIPIIALSQLKRIMDKRMYIKSDLRETGAIEQDADRLLFIYRPFYHKIYADEEGNAYTEEDAFIQIEKERLGSTGVIPVRFNGRFSRFEDKANNVVPIRQTADFDEGYSTNSPF